MSTKLTHSNRESWFETVWEVLHMAREDLIPEGQPEYDDMWSDVCTAMAWIEEETDPYVLAGLTLEMCAWLPDDNMDIPRAEWRDKVITQALKCMQERNITQETDDIDEEVVAWLQS